MSKMKTRSQWKKSQIAACGCCEHFHFSGKQKKIVTRGIRRTQNQQWRKEN